MRIAGGEWRGRTLKVPTGLDVRPTQDMVREALFSMLQTVVRGASFLDLFAGSGAVGLEALSRGASSAAFVERVPRHVACLRANVETLKAGPRCRVFSQDAMEWLGTRRPGGGDVFDVAFADPPYDLAAQMGFADVMRLLAEREVVRPGGVFAAEMRFTQAAVEVPGWDLCRDREYGRTRLALYLRK